MAGTTDNENIPFILVGRASFAFAFGKEKKAHWGFGIGGFYYDLSPQDRLLGEENSFETLYSAKIGYQF